MTEMVWAGSRGRFLLLFGNGSNRNREWGLLCWAETVLRGSREIFLVLFRNG